MIRADLSNQKRNQFSCRTHGKWILAGEHSVLRGGTALVFPVQSRFLDFNYFPHDEPLKLNLATTNRDFEMAFWGVIQRAVQNLQIPMDSLRGIIQLASNIPVGAGMGASATLCVSLAQWFSDLGHLAESERYEFAKNLENLFHGESSGVDVAVALNNKALEFQRPAQMNFFTASWKPVFSLSFCGQRGVTADCIQRVQSIHKKDPVFGSKIDAQMQEAVDLAKHALTQSEQLSELAQAIHLAASCFQEWGLVSRNLQDHMAQLKSCGALATKPTGSGEGGFVLALWRSRQDLPTDFVDDLILA